MSNNNIAINLAITFRNTEGTDALRAYATEKITNCLRKFVHRDTEAHLVLRVEKNRQVADLTAHADGGSFQVSEESDSLYASIDLMVDSLTQQLRKHKEKLTNHYK